MKLINPFDRLKKRNNVPLSLFPASKKTATTMQIGRVVPLYTIDMVQGNRLKLSVEQLTRFMEMNGPLMQNFEVTFGAYFVPYVALDHFFDSAWFQKNVTNAAQLATCLHARDFFNPATPDNLRVKCANLAVYKQNCTGNGSLWQHLGLPYIKAFDDFGGTVVSEAGNSFDLTSLSQLTTFEGYNFQSAKLYPVSDAAPFTLSASDRFLYWAARKSYIGDSASTFADFRTSFDYYAYNVSADNIPYTWSQMFGSKTLPMLVANYLQYIQLQIIRFASDGSWSDYVDSLPFNYAFTTAPNLYRWLAYLRIYSDWYLNPIYTAEEDFRDFVGEAYTLLATGNSMSTAFDVDSNTKLRQFNDLSFFAEYIENGECLPVLWKKDQFTSIVQTDAASSVAIGSTIGENFYNRMYAKFKDLVARMGRDYRQNTKALYGSAVNDNSLQRSQVIGYKSFTVQVGEIAQTSASTKDSNLGSFAGYAMSKDNAGLFDWTANENGMVMIMAYIRPTAVAMAGQVDKSVFKSDYLDYLIPTFGGVGYQEVDAQRFDFTQDARTSIGLEERYSEYMSVPNEISGDMLDVYSYLTADKLFPQIYQYGTSSWYRNLYMWDTPSLHRIFQNNLFDPVAIVAFFNGTVTRQLPATIRTDF